MANTITQVLPKLLAQGLMALRQNAVTTQLVNRDYESLAMQKGNVINIPIPSAIVATNVTPQNVAASNVDFNPTVAVITLDFWKEATFQLSDNDMVSVMNGTIPMQASEAIKALANAIDTFVLGRHVGVFGFVGVPGTTPFSGTLSVAGSARMVLNRNLAPLEDRRGMLDPMAEMNLLTVPNIIQMQQSGEQGPVIRGTIGTKLGFDWYMNQNVGTYTPGTGWVTGFIASTVAGAIGDATLNIINTTASGSIKVGDIFSLVADTNVNTYAVLANTTVSGTVAVAISFYPPLKTAVATGATLVVVGTAYTFNLAFHRDAFAWASRPLQDVSGISNQIQSVVDPITGVALRLEVSRQWRQTTFAYDVLGGSAIVRKEFAVKIAG